MHSFAYIAQAQPVGLGELFGESLKLARAQQLHLTGRVRTRRSARTIANTRRQRQRGGRLREFLGVPLVLR